MATKILHGDGIRRKEGKARHGRGVTFKLADPPRSMLTRDGLYPRVVWLPAAVIEQHDKEAGQLSGVMNVAIHRYMETGETPPFSAVMKRAAPEITWTRTHGGNAVSLLKPSADDIDIRDLAHALANLCRFAGHTREFFSVAQHSVIVSRLCPPELRLAALLHDAGEAFIGDIPSPVKSIMSAAALDEIKLIELTLLCAIGRKFDVDMTPNPVVKHADLCALRAEAELLLPEPIAGFADLPGDPVPEIVPWRAEVAEKNFLAEFSRLTARRNVT